MKWLKDLIPGFLADCLAWLKHAMPGWGTYAAVLGLLGTAAVKWTKDDYDSAAMALIAAFGLFRNRAAVERTDEETVKVKEKVVSVTDRVEVVEDAVGEK